MNTDFWGKPVEKPGRKGMGRRFRSWNTDCQPALHMSPKQTSLY